MPEAGGSQRALELLVFPDGACGTGERHSPWDLQPDSTLTIPTVADLATAPSTGRGGEQRRLAHHGGEKTLFAPRGTPVVTFHPGNEVSLVPGARVRVNALDRNGTPTAMRVLARRNVFTPSM